MRRTVAVFPVLIALWLTGCASINPTSAAGSGNSCEAKVVRAMTSPNSPVAGAYACLDQTDAAFASAVTGQGITDDASFAVYAATDPQYTTARACPNRPASAAAAYHFYEFGGSGGTQAVRLHILANGKVDEINFAGMGTTCADIPK